MCLKITVSGSVGSGKSSIAQYITDRLIGAGFYTENKDDYIEMNDETQADQLCALLDQDLCIEVYTKQEPRAKGKTK